MHEVLSPSILPHAAIRPAFEEEASRAFPALNEARPGDMIGIYLELIHLGEMTPCLSGWFMRAGHDLRTWSDLDLVETASSDAHCVSRAQLAIFSKLRELDFDHIQYLDLTWDRVTPDGMPTRALTIVAHAQMLTVPAEDVEYDTVEDVGRMNHLFLSRVESAHARLKVQASRAAAFNLFTRMSQLEAWTGVPLAYAPLQDTDL